MAKTEYKVGETFQFGLKTLKCVHDKIYECENCALRSVDNNCEHFVGPCTANSRTDGLAVIFIEAEEEKPEWPWKEWRWNYNHVLLGRSSAIILIKTV